MRSSVLSAICAIAACGLVACAEDSLIVTDPATAPGASTPTIEVLLDPDELPSWRDTTYTGYAIPACASFQLASDRSVLQSRPLGRFATLPDSVFVDTARVAIDSFATAYVRFRIDTMRSALPEGGAELTVQALARGFDANEATWTLAREGDPWSTPGGDLGEPLGRDSVAFPSESEEARPDSFVVQLSVDVDSLLTAWREADGEPGYAAVVSGPESELRVTGISLVAGAVPEGIDTVVTIVRSANPTTFIFDPPTPQVSTRLRLAGLPSARYYLDFTLPDSIGLAELRGAIINKAALEFLPAAPPVEPFALVDTITAQAVRLLADPFEFGEKTPVGATLGLPAILNPDSLADGNGIQFDITREVVRWSAAPADSAPVLRIGVVPLPEGGQLGFWEFFSAEDDSGLRPAVRILFTPNPSFLLP